MLEGRRFSASLERELATVLDLAFIGIISNSEFITLSKQIVSLGDRKMLMQILKVVMIRIYVTFSTIQIE